MEKSPKDPKEEKTGKKGGKACGKECEVFSRVVGYFRPVQNWNLGKQQEFKDRKTFDVSKALSHSRKTG